MQREGPRLSVRVYGPLACFTRPEMKVERVSYEVMTPSAARGILEAIVWKPAIRWRVHAIEVHAPIRFMALKRNEVNTRAAQPSSAVQRGLKLPTPYYADEDRAQRNTLALRDVDYVIRASFRLTDRAGTDDNVRKFVEMFSRRMEKGQCHHSPYLGCREFAASFEPADPSRKPILESKELGWMLWDIEFGEENRPMFFEARLTHGVLDVPEAPSMIGVPGTEARP